MTYTELTPKQIAAMEAIDKNFNVDYLPGREEMMQLLDLGIAAHSQPRGKHWKTWALLPKGKALLKQTREAQKA